MTTRRRCFRIDHVRQQQLAISTGEPARPSSSRGACRKPGVARLRRPRRPGATPARQLGERCGWSTLRVHRGHPARSAPRGASRAGVGEGISSYWRRHRRQRAMRGLRRRTHRLEISADGRTEQYVPWRRAGACFGGQALRADDAWRCTGQAAWRRPCQARLAFADVDGWRRLLRDARVDVWQAGRARPLRPAAVPSSAARKAFYDAIFRRSMGAAVGKCCAPAGATQRTAASPALVDTPCILISRAN